MKKLKKEFRTLLLMLAVSAFLATSCEQPQNDKKPKAENITITVNKDAHVTKVQTSFTLKKGTQLGLTALKEKISPIDFEIGYEFGKITVNQATGIEITDISPYTFNEDTKIFICSRLEKEDPALVSLKIDGIKRNIDSVMDFGKISKEIVLVEIDASPNDSIVTSIPNLNDNHWSLNIGKNTLKIKVKKDAKEKDYEVNIERIDSSKPLLSKITIDGKKKEGSEISSNMEFYISDETTEIEVLAETKPDGAKISYTPELQDRKLKTTTKETSLKIVVGEDTEYNIKIKKLAKTKELISTIFALGAKKKGIPTGLSEAQTSDEARQKILNGENVLVELAGDVGKIVIASEEKKWKSVRLNGDLYTKDSINNKGGFESVFVKEILMPEGDDELNIDIEVDDENDKAKILFRVKRYKGTIDVPVDKLFIRGSNVLTGNATFRKLTYEKPEFEGSEPSLIKLSSSINAIKSVTIDGINAPIQTKENIWYAEGSVKGIKPSGKDVKITVEPIDSSKYEPLTWNFHLTYRETEDLGVVYYEINGTKGHKLPRDFQNGFKNGTNPLIQLDANLLNLKFVFNGNIEHVKINDKVIKGEELKEEDDEYILFYSLPITKDEKEIAMDVLPKDLAVYNARHFKFRVQGSEKTESMHPVFREISGDENFPKATFIDKLEGNEKPIFKTNSEYADIVVDLTSYECEFLLDKVKVNDKIVKIQTEETAYGTFYSLKKSFHLLDATPIDVKIEFIAKKGFSNDLNWTFRVQKGDAKPSLPQKLVTIISVNGKGEYNNPMPKEFSDHLIDGINPIHIFDGQKAILEIGAYKRNPVKNVIFKIDEEEKAQVAPTTRMPDRAYTSKYTYDAPDTKEHSVQIIIEPKDEKYSPLVLNFKIKWSGN